MIWSIASSRLPTILTDRMASRYSVLQSSSVAVLALNQAKGLVVATNFHVFGFQRYRSDGQKIFRAVLVYQQGFGGVAYGETVSFCVQHNFECQVQIGFVVHVYMANPVGMAEYGNVGVIHDVAYESLGAARDDQVDTIVLLKHFAHILTGLQKLAPAVRNSCFTGTLDDGLIERLVGAHGLRARLLKARRCRISGRVRKFAPGRRGGFQKSRR